MRDPPKSLGLRRDVERGKVDGLVGRRVGRAPDERRDREVGQHDDDSVRDRGHDQMLWRQKAGHAADPPRSRPDERRGQGGEDKQQNPGRGAAHRAHARKLGALPSAERALRDMSDQLTPEGVTGLHRERVQRPEIPLGQPKQRRPAEPGHDQSDEHDERRPDDAGRLGEPAGRFAEPGGQNERRRAQKDRRQQDLDDPTERELGDADLAEQTARDRKEGALLRRRVVVLEVAKTGIEDRRLGSLVGIGNCFVHGLGV